jgi:hypothetical protein
MVPVEVRAFTLLALCVLLLAAVVAFHLIPRQGQDTAIARPLLLFILAVVAVLSIVVIVQTRQ